MCFLETLKPSGNINDILYDIFFNSSLHMSWWSLYLVTTPPKEDTKNVISSINCSDADEYSNKLPRTKPSLSIKPSSKFFRVVMSAYKYCAGINLCSAVAFIPKSLAH